MFKVYYTDPINNQALAWDEKNLTGALSVAEIFRKKGMTFVTVVSENPDSVGKSGVDSIEENVLPDGSIYQWRKRR